MFEGVYVDEFGNMSDEDFHKELLGEDNQIYLSEDRKKRFTPDQIESYFGIPKGRQTVGWHIVDRGGETAASKKKTMNEVVRPGINEKFEALVRTAEKCVGIHQEHHDDTLMATTSRFNCHNDICRMTEELYRYLFLDFVFTDEQRNSAEQAHDSLKSAAKALAALRIAHAGELVKEARKAFAKIRDGGTVKGEATPNGVVRPRVNEIAASLERAVEESRTKHEKYRDSALASPHFGYRSRSDFYGTYRLSREIGLYTAAKKVFTGNQQRKAEQAYSLLGDAREALRQMRIADAGELVKEAQKAFANIWDGGTAEREATLNEMVRPRVDGLFERLVRTAEKCKRIHGEHYSGALIASVSRFCSENDINLLRQEMSWYNVVTAVFADNRPGNARQSNDLLRSAAKALAAMRIAEAAELVKEAQEEFSEIWGGATRRPAERDSFGSLA